MGKKSFDKFMLQEGLRQDALLHSISSQLGTKNGLFMVFAAFIFTAESTFANLGATLGLQLPHWPLVVSLVLALAGIVTLLWSAHLLSYRMPPVLSVLRTESESFFQLPDIKGLSEEEQMQELEAKFVSSLSRSIDENFDANREISKILGFASALVGGSLSFLLISLLYSLFVFAIRHCLGLS
jgi:hypothetical protein